MGNIEIFTFETLNIIANRLNSGKYNIITVKLSMEMEMGHFISGTITLTSKLSKILAFSFSSSKDITNLSTYFLLTYEITSVIINICIIMHLHKLSNTLTNYRVLSNVTTQTLKKRNTICSINWTISLFSRSRINSHIFDLTGRIKMTI